LSHSRHFDSADRFEVIRKLGSGGMGVVLLAQDNVLGRRVVLKQLREVDPVAELRLEREAQALSRIDHANVMQVFDIIERDDDVFVVMEYIRGRTLGELMREQPLSLERAVVLSLQIAHGLDAVHEQGIIHRDLKPANIMVTEADTAKILDFGLAHFADRTTLTAQSQILGTPVYMSPEQASGKPVSAESDLYAVGVMLYELLTGELPYNALTGPELIAQIVNGTPIPVCERNPLVPEALGQIVGKLLEKNPRDRFRSAADLARQLSRFASDHDLLLGKTTIDVPRRPHARQLPFRLSWIWVAAIAVALIGLYVRQSGGPDSSSSLLILPFEIEAAAPDHEWLSTGIMDNLMESLEGVEGIRVVNRQTVTSALNSLAPTTAGVSIEQVRGIASRVAAGYVLTGEVISQDGATSERASGNVEVRCVLRGLSPNRTIERWELEFTDLQSEFIEAVDRLAVEVAQDLGVSLDPQRRGDARSRHHTQSVDAQKLFEEGLGAYRRRDMEIAEERFRAAVTIDSTYVRAYWYLFQTETDHEEAARVLNHAMLFRLSAPEPLRSILRATHLARLGERDQAISAFEDILQRHPGSVEARLSLARLYGEADRWGDAIGEYEAARVQNPFDYSFYPTLGTARIELGHTTEAVQLFEEWRAENPRELAPLIWLARLKAALGDGVEALALCDSVDAISSGAAPGMRGAILRDVGRLAEAEREFLRLRAESPARWRPNTAQILLAHLEYTRLRPEKGLEWIDEALGIQDDPYARRTAGLLAVQAGRIELAEEHLQAIAGMIGDDYADTTLVQEMGTRRWYFDLAGELAQARGDVRESVRLHRAAARFAGRWDGAEFNEGLARAYLAAGDTIAAIGAFERSISLQKTFAPGALGLARVRIARGEFAAARNVLDPLARHWDHADEDYVRYQELNGLLQELEGR
jgi:serine/threonine-protein kinase